jgi:TolB-like protein
LAYSLGGVIAATPFTAIAIFSIMVGSAAFMAGDRVAATETLFLLVMCGLPALLLWLRSLRPPLGFLRGVAWGGGGFLVATPLGMYLLLSVSASSSPTDAPTVQVRSIAVLPLENLLGDPAQESFVDEMTEALISSIADIGAFEKTAPLTSVMTLKGSNKELPEIARDLGVDAVLEGSVRRMESRVRLTVQLIYVPTGTHVWAESYERDLEWLSEVVRDVATKVSNIALEPMPTERD